jgi:hypothetical protein
MLMKIIQNEVENTLASHRKYIQAWPETMRLSTAHRTSITQDFNFSFYGRFSSLSYIHCSYKEIERVGSEAVGHHFKHSSAS